MFSKCVCSPAFNLMGNELKIMPFGIKYDKICICEEDWRTYSTIQDIFDEGFGVKYGMFCILHPSLWTEKASTTAEIITELH